MKGSTPKQFLPVLGQPMLAHTIRSFEDCGAVDSIAVVVPEAHVDYCKSEIVDKYGYKKVVACVEGGRRRQDSVWKGLTATTGDIVCVHDGVRPAVTPGLITDCVESARLLGAAIAAVPAKDTVKRVRESSVTETLDRLVLWEAQTPQVFKRDILMRAYAKAREDGYYGTDESSLVERLGVKVYVVMGSYSNLKVTSFEDLDVIKVLLEREA